MYRAIKKSQAGDAENYDEIRYEGYGPNGVAVIVETMTDNKNRTASTVRSTFSKKVQTTCNRTKRTMLLSAVIRT